MMTKAMDIVFLPQPDLCHPIQLPWSARYVWRVILIMPLAILKIEPSRGPCSLLAKQIAGGFTGKVKAMHSTFILTSVGLTNF